MAYHILLGSWALVMWQPPQMTSPLLIFNCLLNVVLLIILYALNTLAR